MLASGVSQGVAALGAFGTHRFRARVTEPSAKDRERPAVPAGSIKRTTSQSSEAARANLARLARQTTEDINSRQTVPLPAEQV